MSNNEPDYENNLAFPPQEIKSQDDIKHQDTRSSDVLIKAVEKCEKLEKQLKIAIEAINRGLVYNYTLQSEVREDMDLYFPLYDKSEEKKDLERQNRTLTKALKKIKELD